MTQIGKVVVPGYGARVHSAESDPHTQPGESELSSI